MNKPDNMWIGKRNRLANPHAPVGSGGQGKFRSPGCIGKIVGDCPHPLSPRGRNSNPLELDLVNDDAERYAKRTPSKKRRKKKKTSKPELENKKKKARKPKAKAPPATEPFIRQLKYLDATLKIQVLADGKDDSVQAARTKLEGPQYKFPDYSFDGANKITKYSAKFKFISAIKIQTVYRTGVLSSATSGYGRGTTKVDKNGGNVSLGFHESRHRQDYLNYLQSNPLPPFKLKIGITPQQYEKAQNEFKAAMEKYFKEMDDHSLKKTDEVGYKKSEYCSENKCE